MGRRKGGEEGEMGTKRWGQNSRNGLPGGSSGKQSDCQCRSCRRRRFNPWIQKIPWGRKWQPAPAFFLRISMDRGTWWATIHVITNSQILLSTSQANSKNTIQFSSVQSLSHVQFFVTPWITAHQPSLSIINSWSLLKLISIGDVSNNKVRKS